MSAPFVEANGARIPLIGLGTWELRGRTCARMVEQALRLGYRHIDTAELYDNEHEVGEGLRAAGVKRDALGALCKVKRAGLARHIGVSNFTVALIEEAVKLADEPLVCNQIEMHPFIDQSKVIAACRRHGMAIVAYSPVARGGVSRHKVLARIGKAHGKTAAQVSLRFLVQQGIVVIPRTSRLERLSENLAIFDFELSESEMAEIARFARRDGRIVDYAYSGSPQWD